MSAPALKPPAPGSRAYMALKKLQELGGASERHAWMNLAGWSGPVKSFHAEVISKLVIRNLVYERESAFHISDDGRSLLGVDLDAPREPARELVGAKYVRPIGELPQRPKLRLTVMREGAFDYMAIPSLCGNQRLAYKTSIVVVNGDAQG